MIAPKDGKLLYHLASFDNLKSIFKNGLRPRSKVKKFKDIADSEIIEHRKLKGLDALVPFHFMPLSPFAGAVQDGNPDLDFVYISVTREFAKIKDFKILPKHPLSYQSDPLNFNDGMESIDWDLMNERNYYDNNCKQCCMAECLSSEIISSNDFFVIFVKTEDHMNLVESLYKEVVGKSIPFKITVRKTYFKK